MQTEILCGSILSNKILEELKVLIRNDLGKPGLSVILVGQHAASISYVRRKQAACTRLGIHSELFHFPADVSHSTLLGCIDQLNANPNVHGILVQLPLPGSLSTAAIVNRIHPDKDVDGFHPQNLGKLLARQGGLKACTPRGIMRLLAHYGFSVKGLDAVVIGASQIVGRPMAIELLNESATVTICHSKTLDLARHTRSADLIIAAAGVPKLVTREMVKAGAIVIDVGIHRLDGRLVGDVDGASLMSHVRALSPVPGGVGPMTVAQLMCNTWAAYRQQKGYSS